MPLPDHVGHVASPASNEKKRKRARAVRACDHCRAKKYRCDELDPCSNCRRHKVECAYDLADHVRQRMLPPAAYATSELSNLSHPPEMRAEPVSTAARPEPEASRATPRPVQDGAAVLYHLTRPDVESRLASTAVHDDEDQDVEVSDVNAHTQNPEFHGQTSSIAFLAALKQQTTSLADATLTKPNTDQSSSLVSTFHNNAFSPTSLIHPHQGPESLAENNYYFRLAQPFLAGYFQNLHFIHPILDKASFMNRCEDLWFGKSDHHSDGFVALYYSLMSLGALTRTWDEERMDGLGRLEWSRKMFNLARIALGSLPAVISPNQVQCLFFMAKVSQNELNPSLAYNYLGWATRASFSAGFNRRRNTMEHSGHASDESIPKLWWGLYSLEAEISFALGRPDSLGHDAFHNQVMPQLNGSETDIIAVMVQFARMIKDVSLSIYLSHDTIEQKAGRAFDLERRMDAWLQDVPQMIRPLMSGGATTTTTTTTTSTRSIRSEPMWASKQRLVLQLRFHNVKMVLFRPFLIAGVRKRQHLSGQAWQALGKCVEAAKSTIELMHDMYCTHAFFRTWWYNATYISYAASIVLSYATKAASMDQRREHLTLARKVVEILEVMDESVVASSAAHVIKSIIVSAEQPPHAPSHTDMDAEQTSRDASRPSADGPDGHLFPETGLDSFFDLDPSYDFLSMAFPLDDRPLSLWTDADFPV